MIEADATLVAELRQARLRVAELEARVAAAEARAAAAESRTLVAATLTVTDIGVWHWDIQRNQLTGDDNLARLFGMPVGELGPIEPFLARMHPQDRDRVVAAIRLAVETGGTYDQEYRVATHDGTYRWLHARGWVQRDAEGRAVTFPGVALDITRRKEGEARLRASEERYRTLVESVDQGLCVAELIRDDTGRVVDARLLEANHAFETHSGFSGVIGHTVTEFLPDEGAAWVALLEEAHGSGEPVRIERVVPSLAKWFNVHVQRIGAPEQGRLAILFSDVTERRLADDRLRESEARLRRTLDASPFPAMIHADDGRVVAVNGAWTQLTGYRAEDLPTIEAWTNRAYGERAAAVCAYIHEFVCNLEQMTHEGETPIRTAGGSTQIWDFFSGPLGLDDRGRRLILSTASDVTERRRTESALRESQRRLARLFDTNLLGILFWEIDGPIVDANDEFLRIVGYTRADLDAGRVDWVAMTPPGYHASDARAVEELRRTGQHAPVEKEFVRKDGTQIWVLAGSAILDGPRGVGFVLDIQARKEAEAALRESEKATRAAAAQAESERRLLDAILDAAPVGIVVADETGRIRRMNPANTCIWGPAPHSASAEEYAEWKAWWADGSERDGRRVRADEWAMSRALLGEDAGDQIVRIEPFGRPGERVTILNSAASVRDADGRIVGAVVAQMDITARQEAEQCVREREQRLRYALEATRTVTWEQPCGSEVVTRSDTSEAVLGLPATGTRAEFLAAVHPDDRDALAEGVRRAVAGERPYEFEFRLVHPATGAVRWFLERGMVERGADGQPLETRGLLTDITARRSAEEQARAGQRMEAVGRLAGGVAHEINNALTGVIAFSDLALRRTSPTDPVHRYVEQIARAGDRAVVVTRQLLAFSRRQVLQLRDADIVDVVRQFEPMLRQALGPEMSLRLACTGPAVARVDPVQIEQVLLNLVLNARDAMEYGGRLAIVVSVEDAAALPTPVDLVSPAMPSGPWVCLSVSDNGRGMCASTRAHLFEPFFTTKPVGKGTGLGLATVYGIVKQSNGHIQVESEPGSGTTFRILLPCTAASAPGVIRPADVVQASPSPSAHILVVDDEPIARQAVVATLECHGYTVLAAASVAEAVQVLAGLAQPPDLVISDLVMPGESGADLARRLATSHPETPVLFISGYTGDEAIRKGLLPSGASFLQKPFNLPTLLRQVGELLAHGAAAAASD